MEDMEPGVYKKNQWTAVKGFFGDLNEEYYTHRVVLMFIVWFFQKRIKCILKEHILIEGNRLPNSPYMVPMYCDRCGILIEVVIEERR